MSNLVHNEQTKLLANWLNGIAVSIAVTGYVVPAISHYYDHSKKLPFLTLVSGAGLWTLLSYRINQAARSVLEALRDD